MFLTSCYGMGCANVLAVSYIHHWTSKSECSINRPLRLAVSRWLAVKWRHCLKQLPRLVCSKPTDTAEQYGSDIAIRIAKGVIQCPLLATCNTVVSIKTCVWYRDGRHGNRPVGVGTEGKPVDTSCMTFQLKCTSYILEVARLVKADLPHFDIRCKPWQSDTSHNCCNEHLPSACICISISHFAR